MKIQQDSQNAPEPKSNTSDEVSAQPEQLAVSKSYVFALSKITTLSPVLLKITAKAFSSLQRVFGKKFSKIGHFVKKLTQPQRSKIKLLQQAFAKQSRSAKCALFRSGIVFFSTTLSLVLSMAMDSTHALSNVTNNALGAFFGVRLLVDLLNMVQWVFRLSSFLKLQEKHKANPNSLTPAELEKLQNKKTALHCTRTILDFLSTVSSMYVQIFRIVGLFVPGLTTLILVSGLCSTCFLLGAEMLELVKVLKDVNATKSEKLLQALLVMLNALSAAAIVAEAVCSAVFPPSTIIVMVIFNILQAVYVAIEVKRFQGKVKQHLTTPPAITNVINPLRADPTTGNGS